MMQMIGQLDILELAIIDSSIGIMSLTRDDLDQWVISILDHLAHPSLQAITIINGIK